MTGSALKIATIAKLGWTIRSTQVQHKGFEAKTCILSNKKEDHWKLLIFYLSFNRREVARKLQAEATSEVLQIQARKTSRVHHFYRDNCNQCYYYNKSVLFSS